MNISNKNVGNKEGHHETPVIKINILMLCYAMTILLLLP